jgi:hypothetical protein
MCMSGAYLAAEYLRRIRLCGVWRSGVYAFYHSFDMRWFEWLLSNCATMTFVIVADVLSGTNIRMGL